MPVRVTVAELERAPLPVQRRALHPEQHCGLLKTQGPGDGRRRLLLSDRHEEGRSKLSLETADHGVEGADCGGREAGHLFGLSG